MLTKTKLLEKLSDSKKNFTIFEHEAFFTVNDSTHKRGQIKGAHTKNLFLKNKKNKFFLISCHESSLIDLKKLSKSLNLGNISFANKDYLLKYLGVQPGSVSPFGLLNDMGNIVEFYIDNSLKKFDKINFHPLINTSTINMGFDEFIDFLIENNKKVNIFDFDNYSLIG